MMSPCGFPLEVLEGVPGFKPILKAVIRAQILTLVNQLAEQTGEQMVVLSADVGERTFCQFGSCDGRDFMANRDDVKEQFLQHCVHKFKDRHGTNNHEEIINQDGSDTCEKEDRVQAESVMNTSVPIDTTSENLSKHKHIKTRKRKKVKDEADLDVSLTKCNTESSNQTVVDFHEVEHNPNTYQKRKRTQVDKGKSKHTGRNTCRSASVIDIDGTVKDVYETNNETSEIEETRDTKVPLVELDETIKDIDKGMKTADEIDKDLKTDCQAETDEANRDSQIPEESTVDDLDNTEDYVDQEIEENEHLGLSTDPGTDFSDEQLRVKEPEISEQSQSETSIRPKPGNKLTKMGRKNVSGQPLDDVLRTSIVLKITENGGDAKTGRVPRGMFSQVGRDLGVTISSVTRIWERYVNDGTVKPRHPQGKTSTH